MYLNEHEHLLPVHWRILAVCWLGWLSAFTTLMVFLLLPGCYRDELGLDDAAVGWIKGLAIGATGVGGLLVGIFGDVVGRRPALMAAVALAVAGALSSMSGASASWMMACAVVGGIGIGGQWASGQTLVGETVPPRLRDRFATLTQSGAPLGLALSWILVFQLEPHWGWRNVLSLLLLPSFLIPALSFFVPESDVWRRQGGGGMGGVRRALGRLFDLFEPDVRRIFAVVFVLTMLCMANYWFTWTWLPEFMKRQWSLGDDRTGAWTLPFVAGALLGYYLFALVAEWQGRRVTFTIFCAIMALSTAMLVFGESVILVPLFAFTAGIGTGLWATFGPLYTEAFPTHLRATAGGISMNASRSVSLAAGPLTVALSPDLVLGVGLASFFAAAAGVCIWFVPSEGDKGALPERRTGDMTS